jgi:O-antigen/teichoic acid export membrane protein
MLDRTALLGTGTGYALVAVRVVTGLASFRLAYTTLEARELGFYSVIWSLLGLLILVDFGGGYSLQRLAGALAGRTDEEAIRQRRAAFSTVSALALAVAGGLAVVASALSTVFHLSGRLAADLIPALAVFLVTVIAAYPMAPCREVLRGRRLHAVNNLVDIGCAIGGLTALWLTARCGGGLAAFVAVGGITTLVGNALLAWICTRHPDWHPTWRDANLGTLKELAGFSVATWLNSLLNVAIRLDQVVLSALTSLSQVAIYAPGVRVQTLVLQATGQVLAPLVPVTAGADADPDPLRRQERLRELFLVTFRWSALLALPVALPILVHPQPLLSLLTGEARPSEGMILCARLLVLQALLLRCLADAAKQVLVLSKAPWLVVALGAGETVVALLGGGAVVLATGHPAGLVIGLLTATVTGALGVALPRACRQVGLDLVAFWKAGLRPVALASLLPVVTAAGWWWHPAADGLPGLLIEAACVTMAALPGWWWAGCTAEQRAKVRARLRG